MAVCDWSYFFQLDALSLVAAFASYRSAIHVGKGTQSLPQAVGAYAPTESLLFASVSSQKLFEYSLCKLNSILLICNCK